MKTDELLVLGLLALLVRAATKRRQASAEVGPIGTVLDPALEAMRNSVWGFWA